VLESRSPTHVLVSWNIRFRLILLLPEGWKLEIRNFLAVPGQPESPEIGKGSWPGVAELATAQPTVHMDLNMTMPHLASRDTYKSLPSLYCL